MSEELELCPFCGDEATVFQDRDGLWHPSCIGVKDEECCGIDGGERPGFTEKRHAVAAWNRRQQVPDGYVLVPKTMTDAMRDAGNEIVLCRRKTVLAYRAMLEAAPKPEDVK